VYSYLNIMNRTFKIILCFILVFGVIEIDYGFLTGLYGMPYLNWELKLLFLNFLLCFIGFIIFSVMRQELKRKGLILLVLLIVFFFTSLFSIGIGLKLTVKPNNSKNFFTEQTRKELTFYAEKLLETKYAYIHMYPKESIKAMIINGDSYSEVSVVPDEYLVPLKKYYLIQVHVDHKRGMVTFNYYFNHTMYDYIYCKDSLNEPDRFRKKLTNHWYYYAW
jgi:hypothetical protein